ncbi:uncharacterized protein TNCV_3430541 [Trichonephila clavipes]|nr:uncharacterized protein TNCV_3430541 [Trichonephila clavipes]
MVVCKCIVPLRHGGTLNSRRAASPLVSWVKWEVRWEALAPQINENVTSTKQRLDSLVDDMRIQDRSKVLQLWRLQTLTYRPGADHIRDAPVRRLDQELGNIEKRGTFINEGLTRNKDLLGKLEEEKLEQTLLMESLTKKIYIERENCLGMRRTVAVEGVGLKDYVTDL